jgi:micrococcal nuclease
MSRVGKLVVVLVVVLTAPAWGRDLLAQRTAVPAAEPGAHADTIAERQSAPETQERAAPLRRQRDDQRKTRERRPAPGVPAGAQRGVVERIVDGDTIWVRAEGPGPLPPNATSKIRLLEIDTPETVHPSMPVQCGGPEASAFAASQLPVGSVVYLEADREDTDQYGRFLRYVYRADGRMFNQIAVQQGYAKAVLYPPNDRHIAAMYEAETKARNAGRGLWGLCVTTQAPAAPPAPAPAPQPLVPQHANAGGGCDPNYQPCVPVYPPDVNCSGVNGTVTVVGSDPHNLDGDGDGSGCD